MKASVFYLVIALTISNGLMAQFAIEPTRKYEGTVEYQKTKQPATILEFKYPEKDVEEALENYVDKQGGKVKTNKGFFYVKSLKLHNRENRYFDVYYKVTGSGKGDNARSTVYLILAEPGEDILLRDSSSSNSHAAAVASVGAVTFFSSLGSELGDYDLDKKIHEQEESVLKVNKNLTSLDNKRIELEKQLEGLKTEFEKQKGELEKQNTLLAQLKEQKELKKKKK
jgi:hypothetical protein